MLCIVDEFTRDALAIRVDRKLSLAEVLETLAELMLERGVPEPIRSDNVLPSEAGERAELQVSVRKHAPAV